MELVCPTDALPLDESLCCTGGHAFRTVAGVPVLLTEDEPTHGWCDKARALQDADYPSQRMQPNETPLQWVQRHAVATCGRLYTRPPEWYPVPSLPDPVADPRERFLEIGCAWGRWCIAANRAGYREVVGVDPFVPALEVGIRVADELGAAVQFVAADGRHLPFPTGSFDVVYSYSVFQHWDKAQVQGAISEIARVLRPGGRAMVQLTSAAGVFGRWKRLGERRGWRETTDIRYWSRDELLKAFAVVGPPKIVADGFFTLNPRVDDLAVLPASSRGVVVGSEALRRLPGSARLADSVFVVADKRS